MITQIRNGKFILGDKILDTVSLYFEDDKIIDVTNDVLPCDNIIDAGGNYVSAGFIDMHTHGGGGFDFMDGGEEPIINACNMHLQHGTTSVLPTSLACSAETLKHFIKDVKSVMDNKKTNSRILGVHLEGPYFSLQQSGAQNPDYIKAPQESEYCEIIDMAGNMIKKWSFAPELQGSEDFCKTLIENNIVPSIGHSNGEYEDVLKVYNLGCRTVTHFYSGMSSIVRKDGFRHLGVIETTYLLDNMSAEIIADGMHLPPELLRLIVKNMGTDNLYLVTDSMRGAGCEEGLSFLGRKEECTPCIIENGIAKTLDKKSFAGSVATADRLVRTMVKAANVQLCDAVKMITVNPSKLLKCDDIGVLEKGRKADIVVFDEDITIKKVIANGILVKGV